MKRVLAVLSLVCAAACSSSNPAAPTASGPPNVAGNYSGTGTFTYITLGRVLQCPVTTTVSQNGNSISVAPLVFSGVCATLGSVPVGNVTIDNTGSMGSQTQVIFVASCAGNYNMLASGGFFGNTLQFSFNYTALTPACATTIGNFSFTGNLSK